MERFHAGTYEWLMFAMRRRQGRRLAALNERDSHLARSAAVGQQVRPGQGGPGVPRSRTAPPRNQQYILVPQQEEQAGATTEVPSFMRILFA